MLLSSELFSPLEYRSVNLPSLELELGENASLLVRLDTADGLVPLSDHAFERLVSYFGAPVGFAKKLRSAGRGHIISYLHKQLSEAVQGTNKFVVALHPEAGVVGLSEENSFAFVGPDARELDRQVADYVKDPASPLALKRAEAFGGYVRYLFFLKTPELIKEDKVSPGEGEPLWRWGYELRHSLWGSEPAAFHMSLERMVCANLTYMPEAQYHYALEWKDKAAERIADAVAFLKAPPEPNWSALSHMVERLKRQQASLAEVKLVRRKLTTLLKADDHDTETRERIDTALDWKNIVDAYQIKELNEKPSVQWYKRAETPHNLYDVYNLLTREATHAPSTVDAENRQELLVLAGKLLTGKPDLEDLPPRIDWHQRAYQQQVEALSTPR